MLMLLMSACSSAPLATVNGDAITGLGQLVDSADELALDYFNQEALCFLSYRQGTEVAPFLRCRPVDDWHANGYTAEPFAVFELTKAGDRLAIKGMRPVAYVDGRFAGERLFRPDGKPVPTATHAGVTITSLVNFDSFVDLFEACMNDSGFQVFGTSFAIEEIVEAGFTADVSISKIDYRWPHFSHDLGRDLPAAEQDCTARTLDYLPNWRMVG